MTTDIRKLAGYDNMRGELERNMADSESELNDLPCNICKGTGLYMEHHDPDSIEVTCDCPAGKKKLEEFLIENPEWGDTSSNEMAAVQGKDRRTRDPQQSQLIYFGARNKILQIFSKSQNPNINTTSSF